MNAPQPTAQVFISYSREDRDVAEGLHSLLADRGIETFVDSRSVPAGEDFRSAARQAQAVAFLTVVLVSAASNDAYYQREEVAAAVHAARRRPLSAAVVPVYVDGPPTRDSGVPFGLRGLRSLELTSDFTLVDAAAAIEIALADIEEGHILGGASQNAGDSVYWNVPRITSGLAGDRRRGRILDALNRRKADLDLSDPVFLVGMGGIGKTTLAAQFAHENKDYFEIVGWLHGLDEETVAQDLAAMAPYLGISVASTVTSTAEAVRSALAETTRRWLLVFDDVQDHVVLRWAPRSKQGMVLVTSRSAELSVNPLRLDALDEESVLDFALARGFTPDEAQALAEVSGGLPLILALASGVESREDLKDLMRTVGDPTAGRDALSVRDSALRMSLARALGVLDPPSLTLLEVVALFGDAPTPLWVFETLGAARPAEISRAADALAESALATLGDDSVIRVHRLVADFVRGRLEETGALLGRLEEALGVLLSAFPDSPQDPASWLVCEQLVPHVDALTRREFTPLEGSFVLLDRVASFLLAAGLASDATDVLERTADLAQRWLAPDHPDTLSSLSNLAAAQREAGDLDGARELQQRVLVERERVLGPDHPDTLISLDNLAGTLRMLGDLDGAREMQQRVLVERERVLGPDHPDTLSSLNNLAGTLFEFGSYGEARSMYESALARGWSVLGRDHPDNIRTMSNLAVCTEMLGELDTARDLLERVLDVATSAYGADHPVALTATNNLADLLRRVGQLGEAARLLEVAAHGLTRALGRDHPSTLTSLGNLGTVRYELGDLEGARSSYAEVFDARMRLFGEQHPQTVKARRGLETVVAALDQQ